MCKISQIFISFYKFVAVLKLIYIGWLFYTFLHFVPKIVQNCCDCIDWLLFVSTFSCLLYLGWARIFLKAIELCYIVGVEKMW